jgi:hypothetical protein
VEEATTMGAAASVPMYALEDVLGKGKGLIATKHIPKGTRIISEKPILTVPRHAPNLEQLQIDLYQQVCSLNEDQMREFLALSNIYPYTNSAERYQGIVRTNALPAGQDSREGGVFPKACRINHACDSNATNFWNKNLDQLTIHALRDIWKGEEITISYLSAVRNRRARAEELLQSFKFTCSCQLCSLPPHQVKESDSALDRVHELDNVIEEAGLEGLVSSPRRLLSHVDEQVQLWNQQTSNEVGLVRAYPDAVQISIANGDLARGRVFANRALALYRTALGDDSPEVIQYNELVRDPATHNYYGMSMKWKTMPDDVPQGLEPMDFEDWLWKRKKETASGRQDKLHDREAFPSFNELPNEYDFESDYFDGRNLATCRPRRHWCFLAEIVDFSLFIRLQMDVKDVNGTTVPLFFHTDRRGSELAPSLIQKGYTVAILYAVRHAFMYSDEGIRLENPQMIKVRLPVCDLT